MPNPVNYYIQTNPLTLPVNSVWSSYSATSNAISSTAITMFIYGNEGYSVSMEDFTIGGLQPSYIGPSTVEDIPTEVNIREWESLTSSTGEPPWIELPTGVDKVVMIDGVSSGDPNNFVIVYAYLNSDYEIGTQNIEVILDIDGDATEVNLTDDEVEWDPDFNINVIMSSGADSNCRIITRVTSNIQTSNPSIGDASQAINYPWTLEPQTDSNGNSLLDPWHAQIKVTSSSEPWDTLLYDSPTPYLTGGTWFTGGTINDEYYKYNVFQDNWASNNPWGTPQWNYDHIMLGDGMIPFEAMGEFTPQNTCTYRQNNWDKSTVYWFRIVPEEGYSVCRYNFSINVSSTLYAGDESTPSTGPKNIPNRRWNNTIDFGFGYDGENLSDWLNSPTSYYNSETEFGVSVGSGPGGNSCPQWNTTYGSSNIIAQDNNSSFSMLGGCDTAAAIIGCDGSWSNAYGILPDNFSYNSELGILVSDLCQLACDNTPAYSISSGVNNAYPDWENYWWPSVGWTQEGEGMWNGVENFEVYTGDMGWGFMGTQTLQNMWDATNCVFPYSQVEVPEIFNPYDNSYTFYGFLSGDDGIITFGAVATDLNEGFYGVSEGMKLAFDNNSDGTVDNYMYWRRGATSFANIRALFMANNGDSGYVTWPSSHPMGGMFFIDRNNVLPPGPTGLQVFLDSQGLTSFAINETGESINNQGYDQTLVADPCVDDTSITVNGETCVDIVNDFGCEYWWNPNGQFGNTYVFNSAIPLSNSLQLPSNPIYDSTVFPTLLDFVQDQALNAGYILVKDTCPCTCPDLEAGIVDVEIGGAAVYDPFAYFAESGFLIDGTQNGIYNALVVPTTEYYLNQPGADNVAMYGTENAFGFNNIASNVTGSSYLGLMPVDFTGNEVIIGITGLNEYAPGNTPPDITFYIDGQAMPIEDEEFSIPFSMNIDINSSLGNPYID